MSALTIALGVALGLLLDRALRAAWAWTRPHIAQAAYGRAIAISSRMARDWGLKEWGTDELRRLLSPRTYRRYEFYMRIFWRLRRP